MKIISSIYGCTSDQDHSDHTTDLIMYLSAKEIVMYNKLDEHVMTSHDEDLLLLSASALEQQRGYFAVYDLPVPYWKYFWFD